VKKQARKIVCGNDLKQGGIAIATYAASDDGKLPESNGYDCKYIPSDSYEEIALLADTQKIFVCPEYTLFKKIEVRTLTGAAAELNGVYDMVPFPSSWNNGGGWYIGYYYLGGRDMSSWDWSFMVADASKWTSPLRNSDSGLLPLMADVVELAVGGVIYTEIVHRDGGYIREYTSVEVPPDEMGAEGADVLHLDGSVIWKNMNELEKHPRSMPGFSNSCGYW
jgi:hypothetical protein